MKKAAALTLCLVLACLFAVSGGFSQAEAIPKSEILAEKTELSQLSPDDRFLIVSEAGKAAVSLRPSGVRLAADRPGTELGHRPPVRHRFHSLQYVPL